MDASHSRLAEYLNVDVNELQFGPSTSQNTYVLAQAFRRSLTPGDEIIVTDQDHEANSGFWRRLADHGIVVRDWRVDRSSGRPAPSARYVLHTERPPRLAFMHRSTLLAELHPVSAINTTAHRVG